jgi:tetratricopeptide (TPR) repeat protein
MIVRPMVLTLLLALPSLGAPALKGIPAYAQGLEALNAGLWEVAESRFEEALKTPDLSASDQRALRLKQLETWIRDDRSADALAKLSEPAWANDPETYFWKSQALAGVGRYREAAEGLSPAMENEKATHRVEALLTRASLQLSLNDQDAAFATLEVLGKTGDAKAIRQAKLRQAAILIDQGKSKEARKLLPESKSLPPEDLQEQAFLNAKLLLTEGKAADAATAFTLLLDQPKGQSLLRYHSAILGLADALSQSECTSAAADSLLAAIQLHPDSPLLEAMFKRLQQWLPEQPAPNDAILERLAQWTPAIPPPPTGLFASQDDGATGAWPVMAPKTTDDLSAFALFTRAIGQHRQPTAEAKASAYRLLTRLRIEHPDHFLSPKALLQQGKWLLEDGRGDRAFAALSAIRQMAGSPLIQGEAAFLEARAEFDRGNSAAAATLFDQAATLLPNGPGDLAALNAALVRLQSGPVIAATPGNPERDARIRYDLELERALSLPSPEASCAALKKFLTDHPDTPRTADARLAAADVALHAHPVDLEFPKSQIEIVTADPALLASIDAKRISLLKLRIADQSLLPSDAIIAARSFLNDQPDDQEASMILGRSLFRNGDYHNARLVLEKLAATNPQSPVAPAALMLAARSAALGATASSREESLILFAKVAEGSSGLAPLAKLERARLLTDLNRLDTTIAELQPWFHSMKPTDPLRIPSGLLLAEALYARGAAKPESLTDALAIYDQLLTSAAGRPAVLHRLHYLRGMTLELLPRGNGVQGNREREALENYYTVLQSGSSQPPGEWEWFERCGFRALALLEKAGRWDAAISTASKIASFNGPRAEEAAARAKQLRLEHMIWDD